MTSLGRWLWTALDAFWIASIVTLLERGNLPKSRPRGCLGPLSGRRWTSANATPFSRPNVRLATNVAFRRAALNR